MFPNLKYNLSNTIFKMIIFLPIISFFVGFYLDENSAGAGGYDGDIKWIKSNIKIFLDNDLLTAILHPDFFGNRTPLIYIIQKIFNPFFNNYEIYRFTSFLISLIGPIIFYKLLRIKFFNVEKEILFLIASLIYLSPYYRTSAFWGLNENYGLITAITSFYFLYKVLNKGHFKIFDLTFLIFFSSLSVYFDLKLAFVPLVSFLMIIFSQNNLRVKFITFLSYTILSIPYLSLIMYWDGIVPTKTQLANQNTITSIEDFSKVYFIHLGYAATIISFYLLPILLFTNKNLTNNLKKVFHKKETYIFLLLILLFVFCLFYLFDFEKFTVKDYWIGLGIVHKLSILITDNLFFREIITYIFFFFSFFLIFFFYTLNKIDVIYLAYFFLLSLLLWPLMQEYFDPIILILVFSLFKSVKYFTKTRGLLIFAYFSIFLSIANFYYN